MIIKTQDGWRQWQHGVINIDGHPVSDGSHERGIQLMDAEASYSPFVTPEVSTVLRNHYRNDERVYVDAYTDQMYRQFWFRTLSKLYPTTVEKHCEWLSTGQLLIKIGDDHQVI